MRQIFNAILVSKQFNSTEHKLFFLAIEKKIVIVVIEIRKQKIVNLPVYFCLFSNIDVKLVKSLLAFSRRKWPEYKCESAIKLGAVEYLLYSMHRSL